jgi:hypothetical protein
MSWNFGRERLSIWGSKMKMEYSRGGESDIEAVEPNPLGRGILPFQLGKGEPQGRG